MTLTRRKFSVGLAALLIAAKPRKPRPTTTPTPTPTTTPQETLTWLHAVPGLTQPGAVWIGGAV